MNASRFRILAVAVAALGCAIATSAPVSAVPYSWVDWTTADSTSASGTVNGTSVSFSGNINPAAQTNGGTNFWAVSPSTYTAAGVDNGPPDSDIIRLTGGAGTGTQTLTFSAPLVDPVMAIMSMGQLGVQVLYNFDSPFDVLNVGPGFFDPGGNGSLTELAGNVLGGFEGHGIIQFQGTFSSISWTVPTPEFWHGFQIGIASVPEPAAMLLLALGLTGVMAGRRQRR